MQVIEHTFLNKRRVIATMWGHASSKPKPEPIPVSNADAQVIADEMMENVSSDDEDEQMNFKRGSNGEGNNRKRRVVFDNSDHDDDEDKDMVVSDVDSKNMLKEESHEKPISNEN
ncbi:hypothetical protein LXL04_033835 [Taraxacum kok-saghyz]